MYFKLAALYWSLDHLQLVEMNSLALSLNIQQTLAHHWCPASLDPYWASIQLLCFFAMGWNILRKCWSERL